MTVAGFTGTREGMTFHQSSAVDELVQLSGYSALHHGDCVGADSEAHRIAWRYEVRTESHPPTDERLRAFNEADAVHPAKPYLARNRDIVDACDELIATPKEDQPQERGGAWHTINYAKSVGKPVRIIWPNGVSTVE